MKHKHSHKRESVNTRGRDMTKRIYEALIYLCGAAHTVAFRMGWWDKVRSHSEAASAMHQGISSFYTIMENHPLDTMPLPKGWALTKEGKPVGPAVPLAGVLLGIADYFASQGWDLGGAVLAQLHFKAGQARAHMVEEAKTHA